MSYKKFSKSEFERIFYAFDPDFTLWADRMARGLDSEYIYSADVSNGFTIVLFSSVSVHTDRARAIGNDAIRADLFHKTSLEAVRSASKTLRTDNWMKNLQPKINSLVEIADEAIQCESCGSYLVRKDGKHGEFIGCLNYPKCENTRDIT